MVLKNNDSKKREACTPTYKKVRGFQPLHFIWKDLMIDLIFRGGKKQGTRNPMRNAVRDLVELIRTRYRRDAKIVFLFDAGFLMRLISIFLKNLKLIMCVLEKSSALWKKKSLVLIQRNSRFTETERTSGNTVNSGTSVTNGQLVAEQFILCR